MCVTCSEHARSSSTEVAATITIGAMLGAGALAYLVMAAIWPYLLAAYLTLAVVALPSPRVRRAVLRGAAQGVRWGWQHRSAAAREQTRTAAVGGPPGHQAITGAGTPASIATPGDVAAIEAQLVTLVQHAEQRPAIRAWR
jgi:hypothetical protein